MRALLAFRTAKADVALRPLFAALAPRPPLAAFSSCPSWADRLLSSHLVDDLADGGEHALVLGRDSLADTSIDVGERERHDIEPALAWLRKL